MALINKQIRQDDFPLFWNKRYLGNPFLFLLCYVYFRVYATFMQFLFQRSKKLQYKIAAIAVMGSQEPEEALGPQVIFSKTGTVAGRSHCAPISTLVLPSGFFQQQRNYPIFYGFQNIITITPLSTLGHLLILFLKDVFYLTNNNWLCLKQDIMSAAVT